MKIQGNMTPQNVNNHTTKNLMDSKEDEISISKLKRMLITMINKMKEHMQKQLNEMKEITNKQLR
jgi:hypothetical protein